MSEQRIRFEEVLFFKVNAFVNMDLVAHKIQITPQLFYVFSFANTTPCIHINKFAVMVETVTSTLVSRIERCSNVV